MSVNTFHLFVLGGIALIILMIIFVYARMVVARDMIINRISKAESFVLNEVGNPILRRLNKLFGETDDGFSEKLDEHLMKVLELYLGDKRSSNAQGLLKSLVEKAEHQENVLLAMSADMKLGLPTDKISILNLDDEIMEKINAYKTGDTIRALEWQLDKEGSRIPGIGEKERKKIKKAIAEYKEGRTFANA